MTDYKLIESILNELENNLQLRGHRGYGAGHPHQMGKVKRVYGQSQIEYDEAQEEYDKSTIVSDEEPHVPVQISKAFTTKKLNRGLNE